MTTLLHIDASVRREPRSLSRRLSRIFVEEWRRQRPDDFVLRRDVGLTPPPLVDEAWIAASFASPTDRSAAMHAALSESDGLINEVMAADVIVIGTPMYNYGMPANLKAWFDQVIRLGRTFTFDLARGDWPIEPALSGKALVLLTSSGEFGFAPGGVRQGWNHLDPHIRTCALYLGAQDVRHVAIEYQEFGDDRHARSVADAEAATAALASRLVVEVRATVEAAA